MPRLAFLCASLLAAGLAVAQDKPAEQPHDMGHHHDRFMQGGMHHSLAKGVTLDSKLDSAAHTVTLRIGPIELPAYTSHSQMPQPPDLVWAIPFDGWLLAYHPKLVDGAGNPVPGIVLHHTAFWNTDRSDFLCPNKEEHIFGAGSELTDWIEIPGYGYRVQKGDIDSGTLRHAGKGLNVLRKAEAAKTKSRSKEARADAWIEPHRFDYPVNISALFLAYVCDQIRVGNFQGKKSVAGVLNEFGAANVRNEKDGRRRFGTDRTV